MELDEYYKNEINQLVEFVENWRLKNLIEPEIFPLEMEPGEWDEQVSSYKATI